MAITTSLIVQFGTPDGGGTDASTLTAELDAREDGLNAGNTNFLPGDSPGFLVFASPGVSYTFQTSSGSITPAGTGTIPVEEILTFPLSREQSLRYYPVGGVALTLLAGSGPGLASSGPSVTLAANSVAVVRASYQAAYSSFRLTGVPLALGGLTSFPVVVMVIGA